MAETIYGTWLANTAPLAMLEKDIESAPFFRPVKEISLGLGKALANREKELERYTVANLAVRAQCDKEMKLSDAVCKELKHVSTELAKERKNLSIKEKVDKFYDKFVKEDFWDLRQLAHPGSPDYLDKLKTAQTEWAKLQKDHAVLKKSKVEALLKPLQDPLAKACQAVKERGNPTAATNEATEAAETLRDTVSNIEPRNQVEATYKAGMRLILDKICSELRKGTGARDDKGLRPH
jgi:hypothetical protein